MNDFTFPLRNPCSLPLREQNDRRLNPIQRGRTSHVNSIRRPADHAASISGTSRLSGLRCPDGGPAGHRGQGGVGILDHAVHAMRRSPPGYRQTLLRASFGHTADLTSERLNQRRPWRSRAAHPAGSAAGEPRCGNSRRRSCRHPRCPTAARRTSRCRSTTLMPPNGWPLPGAAVSAARTGSPASSLHRELLRRQRLQQVLLRRRRRRVDPLVVRHAEFAGQPVEQLARIAIWSAR